jgi:hypothetical protein
MTRRHRQIILFSDIFKETKGDETEKRREEKILPVNSKLTDAIQTAVKLLDKQT